MNGKSRKNATFCSPFVAIGAAAIGLSLAAWGTLEKANSSEKGVVIHAHEAKIGSLEGFLKSEKSLSSELRIENELLRAENQLLRDSIFWLGNTVKELRHKLAYHEKSLAAVDAELSKKSGEIKRLKAQIADGEGDKNALMAKIDQVLDEKRQLEAVRKDEVSRHAATAEELMEQQVQKRRLERLASIHESTLIKWSEITPSKAKNSRRLRRLRGDGEKWQVTAIRFEMQNTAADALILDEVFRLAIVDADSGKPLEVPKGAPNQSGSGISFQWTGRAIEFLYMNMEPKSGENFDIRLFHVDDEGKETELPNCARALVRKGKFQ